MKEWWCLRIFWNDGKVSFFTIDNLQTALLLIERFASEKQYLIMFWRELNPMRAITN